MDGIVVLLKPPGMTSSNAVFDVRKIFGIKHAGHLGTLDPGAAGILPICLGRATKLFDILVEKQKTYVFEICFGIATDTLDSYGTVLLREDVHVEREDLLKALPEFLGEQDQTAPAYSAKKVDGQKMYDLARNGMEIPKRVRSIRISQLDFLSETGPNRFLVRVECSVGTYIRKLCEDIGERMGVPACMTFLLRTQEDMFTLDKAFSVRELEQMKEKGTLMDAVISCEEALSVLPEYILKKDRRQPAMNGLETRVNVSDGYYRVYCDGFLGVGEVRNKDLKLKIHLY